ncbi:MAG: hypothetical protein A2Y12_16600 [Planctomycetes bacterium GWF2_42_9]|nr:MAG: hypothetical protein A2Y12_16600 [Planctomycetes bacterium GWF2_42_9]
MRVLVVEDETKLARNIKRILEEEESYVVDVSHDGEDGKYFAESGQYDLIILDLMLPKVNGLEILQSLRNSSVQTPVLILTAKDTVEDVIRGLDMGSDDYMTKPFDLKILLARCRALIRRGYKQPNPKILIGELEIDTRIQQITIKGKSLSLSATEYRLLEYLARRHDEIISKAEIEQHLYDFNSEKFSNVVEAHISTLRKKLGSDSNLIQTFRNRGYVFGENPK